VLDSALRLCRNVSDYGFDQAITGMRQILRRQHKGLATEETYIHWLRHFMAALPQVSLNLSSEQQVERFLTALALERLVPASTQSQAFNALRSVSSGSGLALAEVRGTGTIAVYRHALT
jgi:hypothetical protein